MDERALICAWLKRYVAELEASRLAAPGPAGERFAHEADAARTILWAIESGDYLADLGGSTRH